VRILYVIDSLVGGGAEVSTRTMAGELARRGHTVKVIVLRALDDLGIAGPDVVVEVLSGRRFGQRVRGLRAEIRHFKPDVVHSALYASNQVSRFAALGTGVPVVSSLVSTPYSAGARSASRVPRWKVELVRGWDVLTGWVGVTRFHAVSEGVAAANARALCIRRRKIEVVERGRSRDVLGSYSDARRQQAREALGIPPEAYVLLCVGRQEALKRYEDVVRCLPEIRGRHSQVRLLLAGRRGSGTDAIERAMSERGVEDQVYLLGERGDVPDLLCAADVLAISSVAEGTAGVALEAMALHCPVVCTDVEGVRGVLEDGRNCLLVPVASPTDLAAAVMRLVADGDLRDAIVTAGASDFAERFDLRAATRRTEEFYAQLPAGDRRK